MDQDQRWAQIVKTFFLPPAKSSRAETEIFVTKLMARLSTQELSSPLGWAWELTDTRWLIPALSMAAVVLFLYIAQPRSETIAPLDDLVLMDQRDPNIGDLILPPDPSADNLLALNAEGK